MADRDDLGAEFFDLWTAETSDDLRRVLVLHSPMRSSADAFEPYALLSKHHKVDPSSTAVTAMLMVTDIRWRGGAGNLIRRIEQSGMVDDGPLDLLAEAFLAAGDALFWEVPDEWFGVEILIAIDEADQEFVEGEEDDDERPTVARRQVYPPLRRRAAGRLVGRARSGWAMSTNGRAAIAAGDPSAGVRAWAASLLDPPAPPKEPPAPPTLF